MSSSVLAALSVPAVLVLSAAATPLLVWWERRRPSVPEPVRRQVAAKRGRGVGR